MNVLVNGMGNIGTTLVHLLVEYRNLLGIEKVYLHKRSLSPWNSAERTHIESLGVVLCSSESSDNILCLDDIIQTIDYIFEATANGVGLSNLERYKELSRLKGCSAQGSEKGFGIPFMSGVNDDQVRREKFVNVVSCNTHGTAAILSTFSGKKLENLKQADVVVVRRSEDLGNHTRLVSGNVVARHLSPFTGTHHAIVVMENFLVTDTSIKGWAFVPQEGNSIISTLHAFMLQMDLTDTDEVLQQIQSDLLRGEW